MSKAVVVEDNFPHHDPKYMCEHCCCGKVHAKKAAKRIGWIMLIVFGISIYRAFGRYRVDYPSMAVLVFEMLCTILLFVGIKKKNPRFVMPIVIMWALFFIGSLIIFIALLIACFAPFSPPATFAADVFGYQQTFKRDHDEEVARRLAFGIMAVVVGLFTIIDYWFFTIVKRCYNYLRDREDYRRLYGAYAPGAPLH